MANDFPPMAASLREAQLACVDAMAGKTLVPRDVVTAFLRHRGRVLLVRRSDRVGTYRGRWSAISGYLDHADPLVQARTEIREETALPDAAVRLAARARPLVVDAPELATRWIVHPFLFDVEDAAAVRLDWENVERRWVAPSDLDDYETVPQLAAVCRACLAAEERPPE